MGRYLFWGGCALALLGALVFWLAGTRGVRGEVKSLSDQANARKKNLESWADPERKFDKIVNEHFIKGANKFKKELKDEEKLFREELKSHQMSIEPSAFGEDPPPPASDLLRFRHWLTGKYEERDQVLRKAGIGFPEDPQGRGDVSDWEGVQKEDVPEILLRYLVSLEVYKVMAEAKVEPPSGSEPVERKVDLVGNISFMGFSVAEERAPARGRTRPRERAGERLPVAERRFEVQFVSHLSVVPVVARLIESNRRGVFVVKSADMERVPVRDLVSKADEELLARVVNTKDREAPITSRLSVALLDFKAGEGRR